MATEPTVPPAADEPPGLILLDELIRESYPAVRKYFDENPRLGDWLKMIEIRSKLTSTGASNRKLWQLLDEVRRDLLDGDKNSPSRTKTRSARVRRTVPTPKDAADE